jgi:hypothetical protein
MRRFAIDFRTVAEMMKFISATGYLCTNPPVSQKLALYIQVIDRVSSTASRERP